MPTITPTVTVHVDSPDAALLIGMACGEPHPRGGWVVDGTHYWHTDEALGVALAIIADDLGRRQD